MSPNNTANPNRLNYADAGVDIDAGNALVEAIKPSVRSTARAGSETEIGGFGGLFDLSAAGYNDPILVAANDGVGTKLKIAIESGNHSTVGIDLVAMCVNDLVVQGAEPLFFLDYLATGKLDVAEASAVIEGIAEGCRQAGAALIGGETAEMPGMYSNKDYDLAGFSVGAVERGKLLPTPDIENGDQLLGLASSGVHSNGFSLVRKILEVSGLDWQSTAPFDTDSTLGDVFLEPTRIYVKSLLQAIRSTGAVKALAHITGGGFTENIPRVLPPTLGAHINLTTVPKLPVFEWLAKEGGVTQTEMLRTFNCGIGMVIVVAADQKAALSEVLTAYGEAVFEIGHISDEKPGEVSYSGSLGY